MNLSEIMSLPDESWVDAFQAVVGPVEARKSKAGNMFFTGTLSDPQFPSVSIHATFFGPSPQSLVGKVCHFAGQGMKKSSYNGNAQITIGDKASRQPMGTAPQQSQNPAQGASTPQGGSTCQQPQQNASQGKFRPSITRICYRETRQVRQYEPVTIELEATVPPSGKVLPTFEYLKDVTRKLLEEAATGNPAGMNSAQAADQPQQPAPAQQTQPQQEPQPETPPVDELGEDDVPF